MRCLTTTYYLMFAASLMVSSSVGAVEPEERWDLRLENFFSAGTKPLWLYGRLRDGEWIAVAGSSRDDSRGHNKKSYNRSWYCCDLSAAPLKEGKLKGKVIVHVTPDLWVPLDHKSYTFVLDIDAKVVGEYQLAGDWKLVEVNTKDPTANFGKSGKLTGSGRASSPKPQPDPVTYRMNLQGALVGGDPKYGGRCMVLQLGFDQGELASATFAGLSQKWQVYSRKPFPLENCTTTIDGDGITASVSIPTMTLDMVPAIYHFEIQGRFLETYLLGTYRLTVEVDGKNDIAIDGSFDGNVENRIIRMEERDDRPWYADVRGFEAPLAGEHPRLLFRERDVPALRKKAQTPEGKAILARLRATLNGGNGESMTTSFCESTAAYQHNNKKTPLPLGTYTMGHAAGFGLLYQLTGDKKYADFGRQCFDKALSGVRDRDDRYSFQNPGGALRAGPSIGWYAVGYDLCYDGWDAKSRERFGRAIAEYEQGDKKVYDLEALARGTMPPASNHFGMQIGGASLALLAIEGESFVDQKEIDTLLKIAEASVVRNVSEGFGDGGFFAEGDGTGSMASQISYLTAVLAWRNAAGKDFVNVDRPNVRMTTLKWCYQTVVRDGHPDFWPIRGAYGHNVWSRQGVSGAGYYGIGLGGVTKQQQAAMKWCYTNFLLNVDTEAGGPYDTVSPYPHHAVCAFVNWPTDVREQSPEKVLPHAYRDSKCGFYCWRNRWQDGNDTVITALTNRTAGYMTSKPDRQFSLNTNGKHLRWGTLSEGATTHWATSPMAQTSSLTMADGSCHGVDFSGASGADVMLVTTSSAEGQKVKVGGKTLTFYFPTADKPPLVTATGNTATVGEQRVSISDGNLDFSHKGR
jgi:hypothetical protein